MLIYGAQAQVGALEARIEKQDVRIEDLAKVKTEPKALETGPTMRMPSGADFRGFTTGRVGPKDNALELKRLEILCTKEGVGPSGLMSAGRYGKMIALKFSSSSQA